MARLPDFIIIGSQRCGTSSLYSTLGAHPDIGLSNGGELDEVHYLVNQKRYKRGVEWYKRRFESRAPVVGEKSPMYLQHYLAPRRCKRINPNVKLIALLRNPIDRAYSNYHKALAKGFVDCTFEEALERELDTLPGERADGRFWQSKFWGSNHHLLGFLERGQYARHLIRWFEFFPRNQVMVIKSEWFFAERQYVLEQVCDFIGIKPIDFPAKHLQNLKYEPMRETTRERLRTFFTPDNEALEYLLGWCVGDWI